MRIRDLQVHAPWGVKVAEQYKPEHRSDVAQVNHVILHAAKAAGKLVELQEVAEHTDGAPVTAHTAKRYVADLVVIALRLARLLQFDLEDAVIERIQQKNLEWKPDGAPR